MDQFHIIRAEQAGVFIGKIISVEGSTYKVSNLRRLFRWAGALEVISIAAKGVTNPGGCQFSYQLGDTDISTIHNVIETHPMSVKALVTINKVPAWTQK